MGRFVCVLLLATTPCSFGLAALAADLPPRMEAVAPVAHVPACQSFVYPIPILNLGLVGLKQELSNNQVTARIGYKF
ncbi:MAG: hypothetical protein DMG93_01795 [Acidobacteria bacterium]|nr:MAG: hypothetical protein DMG93_01795 [Acidobacteriota bacterium]